MEKKLKGSLTRDSRLQVFSEISFPLAPDYPIGAISNLYEKIRNFVFIAGVSDTLYYSRRCCLQNGLSTILMTKWDEILCHGALAEKNL